MNFLLYIKELFQPSYISLDSFQLETRPEFRKGLYRIYLVSYSKVIESLSSFLRFGAYKEVGRQGV